MMLVVATSATVVVATTVIAASAATTATSTSKVLNKVLNLLVGSLAILDYAALEVQSLASQRVVCINCNSVFLNLCYLSHKLVLLVIHKCDNSALKNILVVKMTIYCEYLAAYLVNTLSNVFAESLSRCELEIKIATFLQCLNFLLESIECYTEACYKLKGTIIASLLFQLAFAVVYAVKLVNARDKSVLFFHYTYLIYIYVSACKDTHFPLNSGKFNPKI